MFEQAIRQSQSTQSTSDDKDLERHFRNNDVTVWCIEREQDETLYCRLRPETSMLGR
jgi:hypothetical protein